VTPANMSWAGFGHKDWWDERRPRKGSIVWQWKWATESSGPEEWWEGLVTQEEGIQNSLIGKAVVALNDMFGLGP
jgi:hypothetical protein